MTVIATAFQSPILSASRVDIDRGGPTHTISRWSIARFAPDSERHHRRRCAVLPSSWQGLGGAKKRHENETKTRCA